MEDVIEKVKDIIVKNSGTNLTVHALDECNTLKEAGISSIAYIKIIVDLEQEFDLEFDDDILTLDSLQTVNDFVDAVSQQIKKSKN